MSTPLSTVNLIPLEALYQHDDNIVIKSTLAKWNDGYTTYIHPVFESNIDYSLNNNSLFYLTSSKSLFNFLTENPHNTVLLGDYVVLNINSKYVSNVGNELYLTGVSSNDSYFKIIANDDSTYSFLNGTGLYVTVDNQEPFNLNLEAKRTTDELHHQKFKIETQDNQMYITASIINESGVGNSIEERFWSYTKYGPEANRMRANGTYENNDYLFNVTSFDVNFKPNGLTRDHTWVKYYNELENTENNRNVIINENESLSAIKVHHLVDLPYNSNINISNGTMDVNFANMKTIQTSNYEYRRK